MLDAVRLRAWPFPEVVQSYDVRDALLYALSIGLGEDPVDPGQLRFAYEQGGAAFPTLPVVLATPGPWVADPATGITRRLVVHAGEHLEIHRPIPLAATVRARTELLDIADKGAGRGALITVRRTIADQGRGHALATVTTSIFCRADGGFGGTPGSTVTAQPMPDGQPDHVVEMPTSRQAALLYRLNGDWNPLHADPAAARQGGFDRPIAHGLLTFGVVAHAVLRCCCGYAPEGLRAFGLRFTGPVLPGETIRVEIWRSGAQARFRAWAAERSAKVIDQGTATLNA